MALTACPPATPCVRVHDHEQDGCGFLNQVAKERDLHDFVNHRQHERRRTQQQQQQLPELQLQQEQEGQLQLQLQQRKQQQQQQQPQRQRQQQEKQQQKQCPRLQPPRPRAIDRLLLSLFGGRKSAPASSRRGSMVVSPGDFSSTTPCATSQAAPSKQMHGSGPGVGIEFKVGKAHISSPASSQPSPPSSSRACISSSRLSSAHASSSGPCTSPAASGLSRRESCTVLPPSTPSLCPREGLSLGRVIGKGTFALVHECWLADVRVPTGKPEGRPSLHMFKAGEFAVASAVGQEGVGGAHGRGLPKHEGEHSSSSVQDILSTRIHACKVFAKSKLEITSSAGSFSTKPGKLPQTPREVLLNELHLLQELRGHKGIVSLHGACEDADSVYLVMEHCGGGDLHDLLVGPKCELTERQAAHIFRQVVVAVAHCHAKSIVHRDLKPENVLLVRQASSGLEDGKASSEQGHENDHGHHWNQQSHEEHNQAAHKDGAAKEGASCEVSRVHGHDGALGKGSARGEVLHEVRLADFGLALQIPKGSKVWGNAGSRQYKAPEVVANLSYDCKADMWSLGIILHLLLSRRLPGGVADNGVHLSSLTGQGMKDEVDKRKQTDKARGSSSAQDPKGDHLVLKLPEGVSMAAVDLLERLLLFNPSSRASAAEVVNHPWLVRHCGWAELRKKG